MKDELTYLKTLSIFHYVIAAGSALVACFPIIHLVVGITIMAASVVVPVDVETAWSAPPFLFGLFFVVIASTFILIGWAYAVCMVLAGGSLAKKKRYMFCLVMAGISCGITPFGTALGVFTIILLLRPSVKQLFGIPTDPAPPLPAAGE